MSKRDVIDTVGTEVEVSRGMVVVSKESENRILAVKEQYALLNEVKSQILQKDVDYGIVPGTKKESLYKAGAEKFKSLFRLNTTFELEHKEEDRKDFYFRYMFSCKVFDQNGVEIGEGYGQASSHEKKYKYKWLWPNEVPKNMDVTTLPQKTTQNGTKQYAVMNDDEFIANTVLKMAKKRAFVDAILNATGMSAMFTQDMEDMMRVDDMGTTPTAPKVEEKKAEEPKKVDRSQSYGELPKAEETVPPQEPKDTPTVDVSMARKVLMGMWKSAGVTEQTDITKLVNLNKIKGATIDEDCARVLENYSSDKDMFNRQLKHLSLTPKGE